MITKYKICLSRKNCNNNKQQNKKETINNNYLKQNEKFPNIQKKNDYQTKYSNNGINQAKLSSGFNNNFVYFSQSNNYSKINNLNRKLEKEENKIINSIKKNIEQTTKKKEDEKFNLKSENLILKRKLDNIETQFFQFKKATTNELNELKENNSNLENIIKSNNNETIKNLDNKINSLNENIKNLKKTIEEKDILFEDHKMKNKSITENIENSLKKIISEIESLKTQNNNLNQKYIKIEDGLEDKNKKDLIILKNEKELSKVKLEQLKSKYYELDLNNKKLIKKNEELKDQNNELEIKNKELNGQKEILKTQNIELKEQNEKISQQNQEFKIQNEKLIEQNEKLKKINEELQKLNKEIREQNKELIKQNGELQKINEIIKEQNQELKIEKEKSKNKIQDENKTKRYYDKKYAIRGLNNIGNNCYMNSILQLLKNIPQFSYNIIKLIDNGDNFLIQLKNLFLNLCSSDISSVSPKEFKKYLGMEKLGKIFAGNNQYDSSIFYVSLLNILDKKLNIEKIKKIDMTQYKDKSLEERLAIYEKNDYNLKKETFIFDTFYIYFTNEIKCKSCKNIIHIFQKMNFLDFPLVNSNGNVKSLEECFENYQKIKDVKDTCSKCNNFGITHEFIFLKLPPVLIINLKRVGEQTIYFNEIQIPNKLNMKTIIKNSINFSNSIYELRGFIKHDGDEKSGHNYAFCKNMFDDKWYEYNDCICREIKEELNLNKIFFLCYIKLGSNIENFDYLDKIVEALNNKSKIS